MLQGSAGREISKEEGTNRLAPSSIDAVCADDEICLCHKHAEQLHHWWWGCPDLTWGHRAFLCFDQVNRILKGFLCK